MEPGLPRENQDGLRGGGPPWSARVTVVIPARNEADVIGRSVSSLLQQSGIEALHIFVVDDNSADGTGDVVRHIAAQNPQGDRVSVITGTSLPADWSGKLWAVQQGVQQALALY